MTGREYLDMTAKIFRIPKADRKPRIQSLLDEVELSKHADKRIATYSRGMLQRIGLAQALINDPELLILDEPTNGLDPIGRMKIRQLIEGLKARGKTIFFSSHELSEIETVCDEIIMIANGRIIRKGPVSELVSENENLEHYFLDALQKEESSNRMNVKQRTAVPVSQFSALHSFVANNRFSRYPTIPCYVLRGK